MTSDVITFKLTQKKLVNLFGLKNLSNRKCGVHSLAYCVSS